MKHELIFELIAKSFNENKNSHAFLFETNNINKCLEDSRKLIKKANCLNPEKQSCECNICRTIELDNNPDVMTLFPEGTSIKKNQVLEIINKFSTKPLINKMSTYIVVYADKMNVSAANKLLKFLEEPEGTIVGIFITDKLSSIISTIKSRCEIYTINYEDDNILDILNISQDDYNKYYNDISNLIEKLNYMPKYVLMQEFKNIAKKERFEIEFILNMIKKFYTINYEMLTSPTKPIIDDISKISETIGTNDIKTIVKRIKVLDNIISDFEINLNKDLILAKLILMWE